MAVQLLKPRPMRCSSLLPSLGFTTKSLSTVSSTSSSSSPSHYSPWSGLQSWRESPLNNNRLWGLNGPEPLPLSPCSPLEVSEGPMALASSLAEMGSLVLSTSDPLTKSKLSHFAYSRWRTENLPIGESQAPDRPGRPAKPPLVSLFILTTLIGFPIFAFCLLMGNYKISNFDISNFCFVEF